MKFELHRHGGVRISNHVVRMPKQSNASATEQSDALGPYHANPHGAGHAIALEAACERAGPDLEAIHAERTPTSKTDLDR